MEVARSPAVYDERARERIRARLIRYMERHKIGVPTLKDRIERADERGREFPLSTLQRFLRGSHRTMEMYVTLCTQFLDGLDEPMEPADFARALAAFLPSQEPATQLRELSGQYDAAVLPAEAAPLTKVRYDGTVYSTVELRGGAGEACLLALEDEPDRDSSRGDAGRRFTYDGVAVAFGTDIYLLMRNSLTRRPRHYCLTQVAAESGEDETAFAGEAFERPAAGGRDTCFAVQLRKRPGGIVH